MAPPDSVATLTTVHTGWTDIQTEATQFLLNQNVGSLKVPSAGALLAAACVDFSVLPRGYIT